MKNYIIKITYYKSERRREYEVSFCFNDESKVVDSRSTDDNTTIRRRRECTKCNKRYTTYEKIEDIPVLVIKRDLARENFNKEKDN